MSGKRGVMCMIGVYGEGECMGHWPKDEPLTRCYSFMKPWKGRNPSVAKPTTWENIFFHIFHSFHSIETWLQPMFYNF